MELSLAEYYKYMILLIYTLIVYIRRHYVVLNTH